LVKKKKEERKLERGIEGLGGQTDVIKKRKLSPGPPATSRSSLVLPPYLFEPEERRKESMKMKKRLKKELGRLEEERGKRSFF